MAGTQKCVLRIHYNTGWDHRITVRGDRHPLNWESGVDAIWGEGDIWTYTWETDQPGAIAFKVLFDDETWAQGGNGYIRPGETLDVYPYFFHTAGSIDQIHHFDTPIHIYKPPSYHENYAKAYPVIYIHDGQNLFDPEFAFGGRTWSVDQAINRMLGEGLMDEVIAVGVFNRGAGRLNDYTPSFDPNFLGIGAGGGANQYADFLINEIKPFIDTEFRTLPQPRHTGLMGASLGGLVSLYIARRWPFVFSKVASLSSSFWWNNRNLLQDVVQSNKFVPLKIYLDVGTQNDGLPETRAMYQALIQLGYRPGTDLFYFVAHQHAHNETFWGRRVHLPLRLLYPAWSTFAPDPVHQNPEPAAHVG